MPTVDPLTVLRRSISSANLDPYEAAMDALSGASSMSEIYDLAGFVIERVEEEFDCMHCVPGCSECCSHLPLVTLDEWRSIVTWMHDNLTADRRAQIVSKSEWLLTDQKSVLPRWMRLGEVDLESREAVDIVGDMFDNESTMCPFLFDGRCAVYPVRPLICRSYGRMMRTEDDSLYCQPILDRINGALDQGVDVELPLYGPYQEASYDLNGDRSYFSLLPVWVLSHRTNEGDMSDVVVDLSSNGDWPVLDTKWGFGDAFEPEPQVSP
jgi:Fe-S-cluster containining protein